MFYVKTKINEGTYFTTEITDESAYTSCIDCGRELQIDLDEAVVEGHLDLFGLGTFLCRQHVKQPGDGLVGLSPGFCTG